MDIQGQGGVMQDVEESPMAGAFQTNGLAQPVTALPVARMRFCAISYRNRCLACRKIFALIKTCRLTNCREPEAKK